VHGHRVPEIDAAVKGQLDRVAHTTMLGLASEPAIVLADRLMKIVPPNLKKVFYSDAGATATEVAFKLAAQYWYNGGQPQKREFIAFTEAYHGDTFGAMSVGRTELFHRAFMPLMFKVHYAPTPFVYRWGEGASNGGQGASEESVRDAVLGEVEKLLQQHASTIAAICIEPIVQGAAGMITQPARFLKGLRELATRYNVLLVCDEVATGFGRTGRMFACEHEGVQPDLMCVAKGITGGYLPLAATFATQQIFEAFLGDPWEGRTFYHGHTYTGNPLACAAAIASLDLFGKNDLVSQVASKAQVLGKMLHDLRSLQHVGDIRQRGFMAGIELVKDKGTKTRFDSRRRLGAEICQNVRKHGVIIRPLGDVLVMMPPLAMGLDDLRHIVQAVRIEVERIVP
jgi:adenosylmethionine-8-amino-7-oxononanoate aminotransferase